MKNLITLTILLAFAACSESKKEEPAMIKKVVCADSVEQEFFDEQGNPYVLKVAGKCDTILEKAPEN